MPNFDIRKASARFALVRKTANLTQEKLADKLGINPQTIKNYEKAGSDNACYDENDPRINAIAGMKIETLYKMAQLCNVSADYLLGLSDIPSPDPNMQQAVEFTGLSQEALEALQGWAIKIDLPKGESVDLAPVGKRLANIWSWLIIHENARPNGLLLSLDDLCGRMEDLHTAETEFYSTEDGKKGYSPDCYPPYVAAKKEVDLLRFNAHEALGKLWGDYITEYCSPWSEQPQKINWEVIDDGND